MVRGEQAPLRDARHDARSCVYRGDGAAPWQGSRRHFVASRRRVGGSLMRVYRDTRFARDKTPYKTNVGIQFRHERGRDVHAPGFYVHIEPGAIFLGRRHLAPGTRALGGDSRRNRRAAEALATRARRSAFSQALRARRRAARQVAARLSRGRAASPRICGARISSQSCELAEAQTLRPEFVDDVAARFASAAPLMAFLCGALDLEF